MISLDASSNAFLTIRPTWTLAGSCVTAAGQDFVLEQTPFRWIEGIWEADVAVHSASDAGDVWHQLALRLSSDTARRWSEAGINPFIEASAQLKEHLAGVRERGATSILTLL